MRVLIIDDEADIRRIARLSLSRIGGMEVTDAESGPEGVRKAQESPPDAILLDVKMPGFDGPSTLAALRGNPVTSGIPVLFLTAATTPSEMDALGQLGAAGILTKPFDPLVLPSQVRAALEGI